MSPTPRSASISGRLLTASVVLANLAGCDGLPWGSEDSERAITLQPSDVNIIGTSDAIAEVSDLEVLSNGTVWVLNSVEPLFVAFDSSGSVVEMHGRRGGGPEEFAAPGGFVIGGIDGEAWTFDGQRHSIIEVSGSDEPRLEVSLPPDAIPPGTVFGTNAFTGLVGTPRLGDEIVFPRRSGQLESDVFGYWLSVWTADLVAMDLTGQEVREVIDLGSILGDPTDHFDLGDTPLPFPLWYRLWDVCSPDEIRVYDQLRNEVRGFTGGGVEIEPTVLPPVRLTEVDRRDFARVTFDLIAVESMGEVPSRGIQMTSADSNRVLDSAMSRLNATPAQLASLLPRYVDFHCDEEGTQWIQPLDIDSPGPLMGGLRGGRLWLRITPDAEVEEVRLPDDFDPYRFTPERIWGVQRDEFDVASVAWIAVPPVR